MGASQGELTRLGEATGLPAMVGATSVKVQHFASTRSDTQPPVPLTSQESARQSSCCMPWHWVQVICLVLHVEMAVAMSMGLRHT